MIPPRRLAILTAAISAACWLGACASQPSAGCQVTGSHPAFGLAPYWMKYSPLASSGACGERGGEAIGFQKYPDGSLAFRIEGLGSPAAEGRISRPDGGSLNGFARLPAEPNPEGYCEASDFLPASQSFEPTVDRPITLEDGGTGLEPGLPALSRSYELTRLRFLQTARIPGTIFTGELRLTEGSCAATFTTLGLWPQIACDPAKNEGDGGYSLACDPKPGSQINPAFSSKARPLTCGPAGFCELQLTVEELAEQ